jgi:uncharacterized protein HemY
MRLWGADIELALLNREWDRASSLIQEAEKLFGDTIAVRRWKGRMIAQRYAPEEAIPLIRELADPPADWNDANRIDLAYDMALLAYSVGDYGQAEKLAMIAKEAAPKNMAVLLLLLDIGSRAKKPELLERILKDIGDQTNEGAIWHYGEARRLVLLGNDSKDKNYYVEAKSHLVKASETRPTWERIYTLQAEINEREGDSNAAIEQYIESIKKGERSTSVSYRALALLISARRLDDAEKFINLLVESKCPFSPEMKRLEIELMIQLGKKDLALKLIESFAR